MPDAGDPFEEAAGDGERAATKLASALCDRFLGCHEKTGLAPMWADHESCVAFERYFMDFTRAPSCDGSNEVSFEPKLLAACMRAMAEVPCAVMLRAGRETPLWEYAWKRMAPECEPIVSSLFSELHERIDAPKPGEPCSEYNCGPGDACDFAATEGCGVCRPLPKEGEACITPPITDEELYCATGFACAEGICIKDQNRARGEPCLLDEYCGPGLDCDENARCAAVYEEGMPCSGSLICGDWLICREGKCTTSGSKLGEACQIVGSLTTCVRGACIEGTCQPLPSDGEPCHRDCPDCEEQCLSPFVCVDHQCAPGPACGEGRTGDLCAEHFQCAPGYWCTTQNGCAVDDTCMRRCEPLPASVGNACVDDAPEPCDDVCIDGTCKMEHDGCRP